jgi:hypothetical protein
MGRKKILIFKQENEKKNSYFKLMMTPSILGENGQPPKSQLTKKSTCQKVNLSIK